VQRVELLDFEFAKVEVVLEVLDLVDRVGSEVDRRDHELVRDPLLDTERFTLIFGLQSQLVDSVAQLSL